jgi:transcriptional regulator with XRE-family HTH domain
VNYQKIQLLAINCQYKGGFNMIELRLKTYRLKFGLSQREVSDMMKITQAYYWKWEKGKSFPNAQQIMDLCEIFKCTPNDLFGVHGVFEVAMDGLDKEI